ncbi:DUF2235 domain-containing protein [Neptunomonas qingdaonensis]|uniref:Uncharacterized alpha/beta hydrolase domain n=1 Tax=Neptunomonas qingdaonensis TaxID=1045558 RepID=A0A1I2QMW8_9GAMM|nr:DUF2235 domain-containing protein [Neptunomonas qingdaonensis]SFG28993.1 Uncharacterized alpha/beta hydrolase domain [Neptunomonas qingdaonensis]
MSENSAAGTGKNIVIFSDGTGQEGGKKHNTNVYKLFNMIENRTNAQIAFYDRGLGTGIRKITGNALGAGFDKNVLDCYQFISDNYQWGDRLFLFGFSRGAATVRSLSGFISLFGILPQSRPELAQKAYKDIYSISDPDERKEAARTFIERNNTTFCNIDFLGVWDTVAALGVPVKAVNAFFDKIPYFKNSFHDFKLSARVQHAYHAMSIDEERDAFELLPWQTMKNGQSILGNVMTDPRDGDTSAQKGRDRKQTVKQVWFSGVHTDVGGGYKQSGVSDIPLCWMLDRATDDKVLAHPLRLYPFNWVTLNQNVEEVIHDSRMTRTDKFLFNQVSREIFWDDDKHGKPIIHASVLERIGQKCPIQIGKPDDPNDDVPVASKRYTPWVQEIINSGKCEIEPWDNKGYESLQYGINVELDYLKDYDQHSG